MTDVKPIVSIEVERTQSGNPVYENQVVFKMVIVLLHNNSKYIFLNYSINKFELFLSYK